MMFKSCDNMAMSAAILTKSVTSGMHEECVAGVCIASLANLFLFFIGKEWTNMVAPRGAQV